MTQEFDECPDVPRASDLEYLERDVAVTVLPDNRVRFGFGNYRIDADGSAVVMNVEDHA